jgi:cyclic-di-AMP phosphodiesterase PgpH
LIMDAGTKIKLRESRRIKLLIVFVTIILIVMMFPKGESIESEVNVGSIWIQNDLIASTTFEVLKNPVKYENEKLNAAAKVQPIFLRKNDIAQAYLDTIKNYNSIILGFAASSKVETQSGNSYFLSERSFDILKRFNNSPGNFKGQKINSLKESLLLTADILEKIYQQGLLNIPFMQINRDSIALRDGRFEKIIPKTNYFDRYTVEEFISRNLHNSIGSNKEINDALTEYLLFFLKPNLIYNKSLTDDAIFNAKERVPRNIGIVNENERIVAKHDRITPDTKLKIDSYRIAKGEDTSFWNRFTQNFGKFIHIFIIMLPLIIYVYLFRRKIYKDNVKILLIAVVILFVSFLTFLVYHINVSAQVEFLVLVPVASMLLTIVFDSRIGFYVTVVVSMIVGGLRGNDYVFMIINVVAGALSAYTVRDIKNRTQIFRSFFYILIGYIVSIVAFGLERFDTLDEMVSSFAFATANALVSPVFVYGMIIFVEKIFKITTDLILLELTDFNHPLLKELSHLAPGTFNHSMTMGTMVEAAAESIGANSTLARVGAYYHDIGKTLDPASFVENQIQTENIHERLKPEESVKLILNHVQRGIELAKKYNLPKEIIDFIPMHHGTLVISFFLEKAKTLYGEDKVRIDDYRYPGPKPSTRETALVMLADACESAVRAMTDGDPQKIENVINNLFTFRIDDGQLDDSPLTFTDVKKIKESFLKILIGQHHKRIRYPKQDEMEMNKDDE